ncbi:nucleotidyltransferase substrate binding protein [Spirochaeta isovalerica]|uniref:Nucleotidyltransferase substrate binding protein (TIGR01987 family) n=1 Tax=Spirochaeta isovalerica TaxID=150 RepID=A0A841RHX5_9SPIO|nr:nucleotidyltransferase substrate binding protein [Spirochaeta isovalerica]MBB6482138.1 nucleotidyltransferase substrate binding protein (TIGR01987 family) [Spirochaeta isovalerica]
MEDIRWIQRLSNFSKALSNLKEAVDTAKSRELNKLEKQGLIQSFEYTYELAWNTVKDFYTEQGETGIQGSRDAFRMAFNRNLVSDGETLMETIKSRQKTSHSYNEETAEEILQAVINHYYKAFEDLARQLAIEKDKV